MRRFSCHNSKPLYCGARANASRANAKAFWSLAHSSALNDRIVPWRSRRKTQYFIKSAAPECALDDVFNSVRSPLESKVGSTPTLHNRANFHFRDEEHSSLETRVSTLSSP